MTLNGTLNLGNASANYGRLYFTGSQTLSGSGTIQFGGNASNAVYAEDSGSPATLTIASGVTIQGGYGQVDGLNSDASLVNHGKINAATANQIVSISPARRPATSSPTAPSQPATAQPSRSPN